MRQPCSNAIHCFCSTVRPLGKGDEFIAALHIKMTRYVTRHLKELELANTILHGQVIMPALDNEGAGLEKLYDGGRGGGGNSVDRCCSGVVREVGGEESVIIKVLPQTGTVFYDDDDDDILEYWELEMVISGMSMRVENATLPISVAQLGSN